MIYKKKKLNIFLKKLNVKKSLLQEDNKAQLSLEFLVILGVVILVALLVGLYLKQASAKKVADVTTIQDHALS
ncbi:MAG: class III signal peptide-containing protein [archaeon]|jgi:uncharacterized protein (UPF0333 family)|nr:class III signal peptide-containing protein [archaeon]MDD2477794.1 class III signal peptide-containing protein [Candidatus ainarchaeum sp.]MDD3084889.1 class III signal peptide-containing protein [Candidatus ainarchaeum sp.]MDD4221168.1 class III signal peptide-containing protein [Candidatus ainarchaeum sp.]MDD4662880.1 class III signal peptide-containing protein [Candidatus ainarchaeum sp.]